MGRTLPTSADNTPTDPEFGDTSIEKRVRQKRRRAPQLAVDVLGGISDSAYVRRLLVAILLMVLTVALWKAADILLLVFGSILFAIGLRRFGERISHLTGMGQSAGVGVALIVIVGVVVAVSVIFGAQISSQLSEVAKRLPAAMERSLSTNNAESLKSLFQGSEIGNLVSNVVTWGTTLVGAITSAVLVLAAGIYIALDPERYRDGFLALIPPDRTKAAAEAMDEAGLAMGRWFAGQLIAMVMVGTMAIVGLWLIGVPAAIGLGLIAGLLEFIPMLGPIAGAVPAVLIASLQDTSTALWVVALFVLIQQIESNVVMPLVTGKLVEMPAAVGIFSTLAMGVWFGPLGLLFGYPLAIAANVLIRKLYVRDLLGKEAPLPSESEGA